MILWGLGAVILIGLMAIYLTVGEDGEGDGIFREVPGKETVTKQIPSDSTSTLAPYTVRKDTVSNGIELSILLPVNASPVLEIGNNAPGDSTAVLIAQAADIREDNGGIVGSYVVKGELVSKGESKAGFCSIINGNVTLGASDATPMLEQALTDKGYFFRQYPLVVSGLAVENKPKGKSLRKALAEIDGKICVVISRDKATFSDFSKALIGIGVRNAIYLVGSNAYCSYTDADGKKFTFGNIWDKDIDNVNYIVWK